MGKLSPMMRQYKEIKQQNQDCILLFRLGDFYEMFFDDALTVSQELDLTLTGRDCGEEEKAPMCGVPFHSVESYIGRLISKGYKVAMCDQLTEPVAGKIVERGVVRIITPGTVTADSMLDSRKNNFLSAVCMTEEHAAVAFADITTGELTVRALVGDDLDRKIMDELAKFPPSELLYLEKSLPCHEAMIFAKDKLGALLTPIGGFFPELSKRALDYYGESYFDDRNIKSNETIVCVGMIIEYLIQTQIDTSLTLSDVHLHTDDTYMELDSSTVRNLEIFETMRSKDKKGSLLWVLDKTVTGGGSRLLRNWLLKPLGSANLITKRQSATAELHDNAILCDDLQALLKKTNDLQRLSAKVTMNSANAKDLYAIGMTLSIVPILKQQLSSCKSRTLSQISNELDCCEALTQNILTALKDELPVSVRDGDMIADGFDEDVDKYRALLRDSKQILAQLEQRERESTGIKNLKIKYNRVFGYAFEITKSNYQQTPEHYIRKQTLANAERFITQELKDLEHEIFSAQDKLCEREFALFNELQALALEHVKRLQNVATLLSQIDVFTAFASVARANNYVCPTVTQADVIDIKDGRHPVVESIQGRTNFVPNDVFLDGGESKLYILTGPNMAGKSTYMRQVALITLLAQVGSFVPASRATISVVDKIFTRVGASDDLAMGQSTFMVEMSETAAILKNATKKSLLIFDEIGRGTSTYDGMSIARSVVEYVITAKNLGAKTLFATHYHELCMLEKEMSGIKNYNIAVKKRGDDITFLRKIVRGGTDESYGIEVAKLAGVPQRVITRAKEILGSLERGDSPAVVSKTKEREKEQLSFTAESEHEFVKDMAKIDLTNLSEEEAARLLIRYVNLAREL